MATNNVDIKQLLEAGAHFGHKSSRWHPGMAQYIHSKRDGIHIIDLTKTVKKLETAINFVEKVAAEGKQILFVGTKRQASDIVRKAAEATSMPYVVERWLGGMLTNRATIGGRVKYLKDQEAKMESGQLAAKYSKLEVQRFQEEIDSMNTVYGGIKNIAAKPGAVFIVDVIHEANAVREARKLKIPVVAVVDSNADPGSADYLIPANDDAIKTIQLVVDHIQSAVQRGQQSHQKASEKQNSKTDQKTQPAEIDKK